MPTALLVLSVLGLAAGLNAVRPVRWTPLVLASFFAAWLTAELAPQLAVLTVVAAGTLVALGGARGTTGTVAVVVTVVDLAVLGWHIRSGQRAAAAADGALAGFPDQPAHPDHEATSLVRRFFVPMAFTHPDVERIVDVPYGEGSRHKLDVYRHRDRPTGCPTLVQVHGGGWVIGDKREQGRPLMLHLASRGWVCFAPNYRLSPRATFPDHLVDVKRALAWVREHGAEYGADPGFLVITGGSAGGHLAALAALTPGLPEYQPGFEDADTSVSACVPYYGVYDLLGETGTPAAKWRRRRLLERLVFKSTDPAVLEQASPLSRVHAGAPAFLVVHGRNDTLAPVQEARLLVERLRAVSHQPVLYLELPGTQHAFDVFPSIRSAHVVRAVGRFVELVRQRHLAGVRPPDPGR
ncbi:MAG: alpha/beta hydrolase [Actinomycetota bacterium]|nr:alpha/beta hydrolase [Actinomycetota bacterium]